MLRGATATPALVNWVSINGKTKERMTLISSYGNENDIQNNLNKVIELCENLKNELGQEEIALELNSEMYFV